MNWIQSAMLGFFGGICGPMPLSVDAHRALLLRFFGIPSEGVMFRLAVHTASLIIMLSFGSLELRRLMRTARQLRTPVRRRTSHPSLNNAGTLRLLRFAVVLTILGQLLSGLLAGIGQKLYLLAAALLLSGLLQWFSTRMRTANKDGRHMSAADGAIIGVGALAAAVPGISLVGSCACIASMLGASRSYALRIAWTLAAVRHATAVVTELIALAQTGWAVELSALLSAGIGAVAAAVGTYAAIQLIRSMSRPGSISLGGFCYYNWGQALLCMLLFLLV